MRGTIGLGNSLIGGAIGSATLNLLHETARRVLPEAPRVDVVGRRAIAAGLRAAGVEPPPRDELQRLALAGDLASNTIYYALAGAGPARGAAVRGLVLGAIGGLGALAMAPALGLGRDEVARSPARAAMTVAWYALGGLAAGAAMGGLARRG